MPKLNPYLIENKKPIELVQEIEKYEIKKSPLSKAARSKVINKSGSNYLSESKEGYGPVLDGGEPGFRESMRRARKEEDERRRREASSRGEASTGEKIAKVLVVGAATAALGPVGSILAGTGVAMIGHNLDQEVCEIGCEMITSGAIDGAVKTVKK
jgi:hypothetical protein